MKTLSCKGSAPSRCQRFWSLAVPFCAVYPLLVGSTAAAQDLTADVPIPIDGCNLQFLANGDDEIFWTSSFSTDEYRFEDGNGDTLEVVVQWSTTTGAETSPAGFGPRGGNYSPAGVDGVHDFDGVIPIFPVEDPGDCDVDPDAQSYGSFTFLLKFTSLNATGRDGIIQKGNSQWAVDVDVGDDDTVSLGVNVHVATGVDPDE